jgi:hypothetical protein
MIIGVVWSVWHFPLHITGFYGNGIIGFLLRFVTMIPMGVLFTWLYEGSGGNIFSCLLLHTGINDSILLFSPTVTLIANIVMIGFTSIAIFHDRKFKGEHPARSETRKSEIYT